MLDDRFYATEQIEMFLILSVTHIIKIVSMIIESFENLLKKVTIFSSAERGLRHIEIVIVEANNDEAVPMNSVVNISIYILLD